MSQFDFSARISSLLEQQRQPEALAFVRREVSAQVPEALHLLAMWHIVGSIVPRDLPLARRLLADADAVGHPEAYRTLAALLANGSGGPADWAAALALLRRHDPLDPQATHELRLIDAMAVTAEGSPRSPNVAMQVDPDGILRHFPGLLSAAECRHVIATTQDYLAPATVVDPATGRQIRNPVRTADAMVVSPIREDLVLRAISLRLAAASATDIDQGEATSVMRYRPGQEFRLHHDSIDGTSNQRIMTLLVYLSDDFEGGETLFPHLGVEVRPRTGDAILFANVDQGQRQHRAQHAGRAVSRGEKWLLSKWIRERPFSPWTGPERPIR